MVDVLKIEDTSSPKIGGLITGTELYSFYKPQIGLVEVSAKLRLPPAVPAQKN